MRSVVQHCAASDHGQSAVPANGRGSAEHDVGAVAHGDPRTVHPHRGGRDTDQAASQRDCSLCRHRDRTDQKDLGPAQNAGDLHRRGLGTFTFAADDLTVSQGYAEPLRRHGNRRSTVSQSAASQMLDVAYRYHSMLQRTLPCFE